MPSEEVSKLQCLIFKRGAPLKVLDQLKLPHEHTFIEVRNCQDGWRVIHDMNVRGAPAIGLTGILSLATELALGDHTFEMKEDLRQFVINQLDFLVTSRPTGVNLKNEAHLLKDVCERLSADTDVDIPTMIDKLINHAEDRFSIDIKGNEAMGCHGADDIIKRAKTNGPVNVLTHCNTGSLATGGFGTALGVVRALNAKGYLKTAYCTETRPYNQGSRLTAYELVYEKIPSCLIVDSAASALMANKEISAIVVGADRIAANGDTANKIGTLQLAICASHYKVPFYIAAPCSTIDLKTPSGLEIPIEDRPSNEITLCRCAAKDRIPPDGIDCWNPSFDVTPAELITGGIITELGVIHPPVNTCENLRILKIE